MSEWFAAVLLFECIDATADETLHFEEQIRLLRALTDEEAVERGRALGEAEQTEYVAAAGNVCRIVFREILDVQQVVDPDFDAERIKDGTEAYHLFMGPEELEHRRKSLEWRAPDD